MEEASTIKTRTIQQLVKEVQRIDQTKSILKLKKKGYSNVAIAAELDISESTVRRRLSDVK